MSSAETPSVSGGWLGTYNYPSGTNLAPVRFEATLAMQGLLGEFTGTILDDGPLGEADVRGVQRRRNVRWTKTYRRSRRGSTGQVEYEGTLSEDGQRMTGQWRISFLRGDWEAHRLWSASGEAEVIHAESEPLEVGAAGRHGTP